MTPQTAPPGSWSPNPAGGPGMEPSGLGPPGVAVSPNEWVAAATSAQTKLQINQTQPFVTM